MPTRSSSATWNGPLQGGSGTLRIGDGVYEGPYDAPSRFESGDLTNPEELIGAAHAGCYSMALSGALSRAGHEVTRIDTTADVTIEKGESGWDITRIELTVTGEVAGIDQEAFTTFAQDAKAGCPVSKALAGVREITVDAKLTS